MKKYFVTLLLAITALTAPLAYLDANEAVRAGNTALNSSSGVASALTTSWLCLGANVAIGAGVGVAAGAVSTAVSVPVFSATEYGAAVVNTGANLSKLNKECILDAITVLIREALIASLTDSIITWINGGFEGSPAFIGNLEGFLWGVADNVSLDFIRGSSLDFICSPFQLDIRGILAIEYARGDIGGVSGANRANFQRRISCSLRDATQNIDAFLEDPLVGGGWDAWYEIFVKPQNTPLGAYALSRLELSKRVHDAVQEEVKQLEFNDGFLSKGRCWFYSQEPDEPPIRDISAETKTRAGCQAYNGTWEVVTPGGQINEQLAKTLNLPLEQLALADEFQEIINALMAQLTKQVITSVDGLLGLSERGSGSSSGNRSYLNALVDETQASSFEAFRGLLEGEIRAGISANQAYIQVLNSTIGVFTQSKTALETLVSCSAFADTVAREAEATQILATRVEPLIAAYLQEKEDVEASIEILEFLLQDALTANETSALNQVSDTYEGLRATRAVKEQGDINALVAARDAEQTNLGTYTRQIETCTVPSAPQEGGL
jgi:hypothetical protein